MGSVYSILKQLCEERGVSAYKMCKDTGMQPSIMSDLKMGRKHTLSAKSMAKVAGYFGIPMEKLVAEENIEQNVEELVCDGKQSNDNLLYERIEKLCHDNYITPYKMCKDISLSQGAITDLKNGRKHSLSAGNMAKVAEYFNVSVDWLMTGDISKSFDSFQQPSIPAPTVVEDEPMVESIISTRVMLVSMVEKAIQAANAYTQAYSDIFMTSGWESLSEELRENADGICERCGKKATTLHVHHIRPTKYGYPRICDKKWLVVLCPSCHSYIHSKANIHHELIVVPEGEEL